MAKLYYIFTRGGGVLVTHRHFVFLQEITCKIAKLYILVQKFLVLHIFSFNYIFNLGYDSFKIHFHCKLILFH